MSKPKIPVRYEKGKLYWTEARCNAIKVGDEAGKGAQGNGYHCFRTKDGLQLVHRVVWELHNGEIPKGMVIDHINIDHTDNRIENLRCVTYRENGLNRKKRTKGFTWCKRSKKFISQITINNKHIHLGEYDNMIDAHIAYLTHLRNEVIA